MHYLAKGLAFSNQFNNKKDMMKVQLKFWQLVSGYPTK